MIRTLFINLAIFSSTLSVSQAQTFSQRVNQLFFNVDVSNRSPAIIDSFLSVLQLQHSEAEIAQWNLNVAMEMKSTKSWSSRHEFAFTESPLPGLKVEKGIIAVTLGETDSTKKLLNLNWGLQFSDKAAARKYFEELKLLFGELATNKKLEHNKYLGDIAQFSTNSRLATGVRDITFSLKKSPLANKYEITLVLGNNFRSE